MSKKSLAALSVASVARLPRRPAPPADLSERETALWKGITASLPADWFAPGDAPMLAAYCRAIVLHERVSEEAEGAALTIRGAKGGEIANPIFRMQDMAARLMASLATKLRLAHSSRWTEQKAASKASKTRGARRPWEAE